MPHIIAQTGAGGGYLSLAGITALCLPGYFFFPPRLDDTERKQTPFRAKFLILAGFAFIFGVASSGMWAFTERMGVAIGMNVTDVGYLLGVGTFFGLVGAGLAAVIGDKFVHFNHNRHFATDYGWLCHSSSFIRTFFHCFISDFQVCPELQ